MADTESSPSGFVDAGLLFFVSTSLLELNLQEEKLIRSADKMIGEHLAQKERIDLITRIRFRVIKYNN